MPVKSIAKRKEHNRASFKVFELSNAWNETQQDHTILCELYALFTFVISARFVFQSNRRYLIAWLARISLFFFSSYVLLSTNIRVYLSLIKPIDLFMIHSHPQTNFHHSSIIPNRLVSSVVRTSDIFNRWVTERCVVSQLRCSKGWKQFSGSCYYPSLMISTVDKANETCQRLQVNSTHLMRIRHVPELSYAAHLYATNRLTELLVEVDPEVLKSMKRLSLWNVVDF